MKKTIISLVLTLTVYALQSCRENELYREEIKELQQVDKINNAEYMKTESDSSTVTETPAGIGDEIEPTDPPPKDKGQWKMKVNH